MTAPTAGVSLRLTHSIDEDGEYDAFTNVKADILMNTKKIGSIEAVIIDRQRVPDGYFLSAMDGHSQSLQYVGSTVFEPRYGRTKLQSLAEYDDMEFYTMYISEFHIDDDWKTNTDIGTAALHQFLHHPFIKGDLKYGCSKVSSAVYILDPIEAMSKEERAVFEAARAKHRMYHDFINPPEETDEDRRAEVAEKQRMDVLARKDATSFLRNGFFQDPAIARQGEDRFLVASHGHWKEPLLSHAEAEAIQFYIPPPKPPAPMGKDMEILKAVIALSSKYRHSESPMPHSEVTALRNEITRLIHAGGSLFRSHAIHAACANNDEIVLDCLLQMDPTIIDSLDKENCTPLMIAAEEAAGRNSINGIPETNLIDSLLAAGANKQTEDPFGLTAYGHFKKMTKGYEEMMNALMGKSSMTSRAHPTHLMVERKLLPPLGPTTADLSCGQGAESGFVDYSQEDREHDASMFEDDHYEDY